MTDRLREAATAWLVVGVKWAVAILVVGAALMFVAGDYGLVRRQAQNGQRAYDELVRLQQAAKAAAAPKPGAP